MFSRGRYNSSSATGEGLYIQPLGVSPSARNNTCSNRVISVVPPYTDCTPVFQRFIADIQEAMTQGNSVVSPDGVCRRIFLDPVAVLGDTPGINNILDVSGHEALAYCHRCSFRTGPKEALNNRYINDSAKWLSPAMRRSMTRHSAVALMEPPGEYWKAVGIRKNPSQSNQIMQDLAVKILDSTPDIPLTSNGQKVVPVVFDPYTVATIAPDHLISGICRMCITVAYLSCASRDCRIRFETELLHISSHSHTAPQRKLFDHDSRRLITQTMSQMYVLGLSTCRAYCETHGFPMPSPTDMGRTVDNSLSEATTNDGMMMAIRLKTTHLLSGLAALIRVLWQNSCMKFNQDGTEVNTSIFHLKRREYRAFQYSFNCLSSFCNPSEAMRRRFLTTEGKIRDDIRCSRSLLFYDECIQQLSKPNVHRLYELLYQCLFTWNHLVWCGEIGLERTHQRVKLAVENTIYL